MGQSQSPGNAEVPIYADDGVTVIGTRKGDDPSAIEGPGKQRWFDMPGLQHVQRAAMVMHGLPSSSFSHGHASTAERGSTRLLVQNLLERRVRVCCGSEGRDVRAFGHEELDILSSGVRVQDPDSGAVLCEFEGLPREPIPGQRLAVVLRQVGGAVCVHLQYLPWRPLAGEQPQRKEPEPPAPTGAEDAEERASDPARLALEAELMEAVQRGDEDRVRELLAKLHGSS
mmetsp:Transcript_6022/g.16170  ORF Transcript_6022/g.16170 Transcript_6022/m.16170 type:complete len:228 (-) Transcript_6022:18-701(-)